jgi:hypothetical protein
MWRIVMKKIKILCVLLLMLLCWKSAESSDSDRLNLDIDWEKFSIDNIECLREKLALDKKDIPNETRAKIAHCIFLQMGKNLTPKVNDDMSVCHARFLTGLCKCPRSKCPPCSLCKASSSDSPKECK